MTVSERERLEVRIAWDDTSVVSVDNPGGASTLSRPSRAIAPESPGLQRLLSHLERTVRARQGMGIAAIQIGLPVQVVLLQRQDGNGRRYFQALLNPGIVQSSTDTISSWEHCLSVPWGYRYTSRPRKLLIRYQDSAGGRKLETLRDAEAVVFAHELDHLRGRLLNRGLAREWFVPEKDMPAFVGPIERECAILAPTSCDGLMRTRWLERRRRQ